MLFGLEHVFHAEPFNTSAKHALLAIEPVLSLNRCTLQLNMLLVALRLTEVKRQNRRGAVGIFGSAAVVMV